MKIASRMTVGGQDYVLPDSPSSTRAVLRANGIPDSSTVCTACPYFRHTPNGATLCRGNPCLDRGAWVPLHMFVVAQITD